MSRIGKKPLKLPQGVTLALEGRDLRVKGPKGEVRRALPESVSVEVEGDVVRVERASEEKHVRSCHGTVRSVLENDIRGVVEPYRKILEIQGVGYAASLRGAALALKVGYSNEVVLDVPAGLRVELPSATRIAVTGADAQLVGEFAAKVRHVRPPEPYNGKGIRYEGERVQRKAGKSFTSTGA